MPGLAFAGRKKLLAFWKLLEDRQTAPLATTCPYIHSRPAPFTVSSLDASSRRLISIPPWYVRPRAKPPLLQASDLRGYATRWREQRTSG